MKGAQEKTSDCSDTRGLAATRVARVVAAFCVGQQRIGLAVSGGRDSMGLTGAAIEAGLGARCELLHVHHGTGRFADRAASLVRSEARRLGLGFSQTGIPSSTPSTETHWRAARLSALGELAERRELGWVLLAQHAADLRESVALHLLRGHRGARALSGPACLRPLTSKVMLLRPCFAEAPSLEPGALAEAAARNDIAHVNDPGNRDLSIPRNALRVWLASAEGTAWQPRLSALSLQARARLGRLRAALVAALEDGLQPCGKGCRITRAALQAPEGQASLSWLAELLRLLCASLQSPRDLQLTRGLLLDLLRELGQARSSQRSLPATPHPVGLLLRPDGLHLPHEALRSAESATCLLLGLAQLPWEAR